MHSGKHVCLAYIPEKPQSFLSSKTFCQAIIQNLKNFDDLVMNQFKFQLILSLLPFYFHLIAVLNPVCYANSNSVHSIGTDSQLKYECLTNMKSSKYELFL